MRPTDPSPLSASVGASPSVEESPAWALSEPIWAAPTPTTGWTDYVLQVELIAGSEPGAHRIGLVFRAPDLRTGYVWEVDAAAGRLTPLLRVEGETTPLAEPLDFDPIPSGQRFAVRIVVEGDHLQTRVDGRALPTIVDQRFSVGGVGLTTRPGARCTVTSVHVHGPGDETWLEQDFTDDRTVFAVGAVVDGRLQVAQGANGLYPVQAEWAFLRGEVELPPRLRWARLRVAAASPEPGRQFVHRTSMNGTELGVGPIRSVAAETRYDSYDVTSLVRPGSNAVGALAWTTADQRFQAELVVGTADGELLRWGTGPDWRGIDGAEVYPTVGSIGTGFYAAPVEDLQYEAFPVGFTEPGFDDRHWPPVDLRPAFTELQLDPTAAVSVQEYRPISVRRLGPGAAVLDFGRTHVGGVRVCAELDRPVALSLRFAEQLDDHGRPRHRMATGNVYQDRWALPAGPVDAATWGLRVFRYLEVSGMDAEAAATAIRARGHVYDLGDLATVATDDARLNDVLELCRTTMVSNNVNLLVDSWSREREPYEADAYLQARSNAAVGSDSSMTRYALEYLLRRRTWPTEWPFYLVLAGYEYWLRSGDRGFLDDHYSSLRGLLPDQWLDRETGLVIKDFGNDGSSSRTDQDIVDWPPSERDGYVFGPVNTAVNALAHGAFSTMAKIAEALGRTAEATELRVIADRLADAINTRLWDADAGRYRDGLDAAGSPIDHYAQHADVFAAAFGVADADRLRRIGERIARDGVRTSVYVAPFLLEALYAAGRADDARRLLTGSGPRSWAAMIDQGVGATMEAWNEEIKPNVSCAHPWAASPLFVVAELMAGIRPLTAGYREFAVRPQPGGDGLIRQTLPTVAGTIAVTVATEPRQWRVEVTVPEGCRCRLELPQQLTDLTDGLDRVIDRAALTQLPAGRHLIIARAMTTTAD